jgi:UDP-N-acetylmuramoyl-L-alanyl-D-glutamate--2,6-diaminopimelate ligase
VMAIPSMFIAWERALAKSLAELACAIGLAAQPSWEKVDVTGICEDTRRLIPGDLFVAISGNDQDGSLHVGRAIDCGAVAVLAERELPATVPVLVVPRARVALAQLAAAFYGDPTRELFTVGVTGTNGKTTVCHWIADILGLSETTVVSTVHNQSLGFPGLTTPPSPVIQSVARSAADAGAQNLVLEASSAGIDQERVSAVDFDACVFTNLSLEHVRHHNGLVAYRNAKQKLFETLKPEAWAIVNANDPMAEVLAAATSAHVMRYGCDCRADIRASDIHLEPRSSQFTVTVGRDQEMDVRLSLPGSHNISNALAAISVGVAAGLPMQVISDRLTQARPIPGRSQFLSHADGRVAVIDFAHNGASLDALLSSLKPSVRRLIVVFGCPGDGEREKRLSMGAASAQWADQIILTSDNPKREEPHSIAEEIREGMGGFSIPVSIILDRARAIGIAVDLAGPGDLVVVAGKGHETEQLVQGKRLSYSDAGTLRDLGFLIDTGFADLVHAETSPADD